MEELISRISESVGIDADVAQKAVGMILSFLQKEGPSDKVEQMIAAFPGAKELIAEGEGGGGMLGGLLSAVGGGGIMGLGSQLMGMGLGMGEVTGVAKETLGFAREKIGDEAIDDVVNAIPGLSQFI